jgi:tRNA(adenine34) deaminase
MNYEDYMKQALRLAAKALFAGEFPVGCIIVYDDKIVAEGYRRNAGRGLANEMDHAEIIALRRLSDRLQDMDKSRITVFTTMEPCLMCFGALLINGVRNIVWAYEDAMGGACACDLSTLSPLYRDQKVNIVSHILRQDSLELFKAFFLNPENDYWKDSLLAEYTLEQ